MTKNEFIANLTRELKKNNVTEIEDIINEYQQHFDFKMADGFSEEEIAARLNEPATIALQYGKEKSPKFSGKKIAAVVGIGFIDLFVSFFFILLFAFGIIIVTFSLSSAVISVSLIGKFNIYSLIPPMPYHIAVIFALSFIALFVLSAVGSFYFYAYIRQLMRSYARFHYNILATATDKANLPPLTIHPKIAAKTKRIIRSITLISLTIFAASSLLAIIFSMFSSGSIEFWHSWGWFGYK